MPDPERWLDDYGDYLYRYALSRVRKRDVAEDMVQETLHSALGAAGRFEGRSSEKTWLFGILRNKLGDYLRTLGREPSFTDLGLSDQRTSDKFVNGCWVREHGPRVWKPDASEVMQQSEFWKTLHGCLSELPERSANAFILREVEGTATDEICVDLGISANNLGVILHRARMALRQCLEAKWFGDNPKKRKGR